MAPPSLRYAVFLGCTEISSSSAPPSKALAAIVRTEAGTNTRRTAIFLLFAIAKRFSPISVTSVLPMRSGISATGPLPLYERMISVPSCSFPNVHSFLKSSTVFCPEAARSMARICAKSSSVSLLGKFALLYASSTAFASASHFSFCSKTFISSGRSIFCTSIRRNSSCR